MAPAGVFLLMTAMFALVMSAIPTATRPELSRGGIMHKRDDTPRPTDNYTFDGLICRVPTWKESIFWKSFDSYQYPYLAQVKGQPHLSAGPRTCSRVSCTHNTAIAWCNDTDEDLTLDSWQTIIDSAKYIESKCVRYASSSDSGGRLSGQLFYKEQFNVYVRDEPC